MTEWWPRNNLKKKSTFWAAASFPSPAVGRVAGGLSATAPNRTTATKAHQNAAFLVKPSKDAWSNPTDLRPGEDGAALMYLGGE